MGTGWQQLLVRDDVGMQNVHVLPLGDLVPHTHDDNCLCGPAIRWSEIGFAKNIIHFSYDNREAEELD